MHLRLTLLISILILSGCITPEKIERDNRTASQYEKFASKQKAAGMKEVADYWENEAKKKRQHDSDAVLLGSMYNLFFQRESQMESASW